MFFFDIKCFILISIFENILVLEGLKKVKEHAPSRSLYLRNDRKNNDFDYSFKDWETTTPDAVYFLSNKPINITENEIDNKTLPKEATVIIATNITYSEQTIPTVENLTIVTQEINEQVISEVMTNQEITSNTEFHFSNPTSETAIPTFQDINATIYLTNSSIEVQNSSFPDVEETEGFHVTLPSIATAEDLLNWLATTSSTVYTTVVPPPPTINIEDLMPGSTDDILHHTNPSTLIPTNSILEEIKDDIKKKQGHFTSSLLGLLDVLSNKSSSDVKKLLTALNDRINRFVALDALAVFGNMIVEVFQSVTQMLILAPDDIRKEYFKFATYSVENRHTAMRDDVNSVFDVVDGIYTDQDVITIAFVLKQIDEFPNIKTDILTLVTDTLNAFIFGPHSRIVGTAKERLLLMEIHSAIQDRLYPGQNLGRRFRKGIENGKFLRQWESTNAIAVNPQSARKQFKYKTTSIHHFKHKSTIRNTKPIKTKRVQHHSYRKNTKDKYYAKKNATTVKNFYEDRYIRKIALEKSLQFHSSASSESSFSHNESSGYSLESRYKYKSKTVNDKYNFKNDDRYLKANNEYLNKNKPKSKLEVNKVSTKHKSVLTQESKPYSAVFNKLMKAQRKEDNILKQNVIDALIRFGKRINRKEIKKRINNVRNIDSFSDDEAILKSNIYKVFGLTNDFRKQLRTLNILRRTPPA